MSVRRLEQRMAVAAAAERRVDDGAGGDGVEDRGDLVDHHGVVFERRHCVISWRPAVSCCS